MEWGVHEYRLDGKGLPSEFIQCPKCKAVSGDDWVQCKGECPMEGSPYYDPNSHFSAGEGDDRGDQ